MLLSISKIFLDFYYDKSIFNIIVFPIKSIELIIAKLIILLKIPFVISFSILFVSTVIYGIDKNMKISYFMISLLLSFTLPLFIILPLLIVSILFFNFIGKNIYLNFKKGIYIFSLLISIIFVFTVKFFDISMLLKEINFDKYKFIFFILGGSKFLLEYILHNESFILILKAVLILFFEIFIFYLLFNKLYYKTILKIALTNKKLYKNKISNYGELTNFIIIELKSITRNYFLFTNLVLKILFVPIPILLIFFNKDNLSFILNLTEDIYVKILLMVIYLQASLNITSATSISRDKNIYLIEKTLPINLKYKIYNKIIVGVIINFIPILINILFLIILFKINFINILIIIFSAILICFSESINCFIKNIKNPFIDYEKEQDIIYSNYNVISLFIKSLIIFFVILFLLLKFNLSFKFIIIVFIIKFIISILFYKINENKYINILKNL